MALLAPDHDHVVASGPDETTLSLASASCQDDQPPVIVGDWWCHECGRAEADERTRLCPECAYRTRARVTASWQVAAAVAAASVMSVAATVAALVVWRRRGRPGGLR
jgi:uncharacterized paraquat-inducible protein A